MANKQITDLQLRDAFSVTCNFPVDDTLQTYRVTGQQILDFLSDRLAPPGQITAWGGAAAPTGYALCDGSELSQASYPTLFANIGTTWNTCRNQSTGAAYSTPGVGNFRIPDLRGTFIRGVGTSNGYVATTLGATQDDSTAKNGLSLTGSPPSLTGTTSFANTSHTHTIAHTHDISHTHNIAHSHQYQAMVNGNWYARISADNSSTSVSSSDSGMFDDANVAGSGSASVITRISGPITFPANLWTTGVGSNANSGTGSSAASGAASTSNSGASSSSSSGTPSATASVGITAGDYSVAAGDAETRPVNVGVNYIIKT